MDERESNQIHTIVNEVPAIELISYRDEELIDILIETAKQYVHDCGVFEHNLDRAAIENLRGAIDVINEKYINQI